MRRFCRIAVPLLLVYSGVADQNPSAPHGWYRRTDKVSSGMVCLDHDPVTAGTLQTVGLVVIASGTNPCLTQVRRNELGDSAGTSKFERADITKANAGETWLFLNVRTSNIPKIAMLRTNLEGDDKVKRVYIEPRP